MGRQPARWGWAAALALSVPLAAQATPWLPASQQPGPPITTFHQAVEDAWGRLPQRRNLDARLNVASAKLQAGGTLFPDAPYVTGTYVNDKIAGSNEDYITAQGEVGTPIWLPGEGTATQNAANADAATIRADEAAMHLALAAHLLAVVERAALAANEAAVAQRHFALSQSLQAGLNRSVAVGESAESDALAAQAEAEQARISLTTAQADLASAQAALQVLTGSDAIPRLAAPPAPPVMAALVSATAITPGVAEALADHPRVAASAHAVAAAEAKARLTRIENRDHPEIGLQVINEKQPGSAWDTRVGLMLRLPFATSGRNAPLRAQAEADITQAEVQLDEVQRDVLVGIRQSAAQLAGAEQANAAAARAATSLDRRRAQIDHAWRLGEMPLIELVRANELAFDADLARGKAVTERDVARLKLLIAMGQLP